MWPLAIELGPLYLSTFGIFLAIAYIVATFFFFRAAKHGIEYSYETIFDASIVTMLGALLGARVAYIIIHPQEFASSFLFYFLFRERPGFSYMGGVLGAAVALYAFTRLRRLSFWQMLDIGTVGIVWGYLLGQVGSLLDGFSFGRPARLPWAMPLFGSSTRYQPLPLYEVLASFLILFSLYYLKKGKSLKFLPVGSLFLLTFVWLNLFSGFINFWRGGQAVFLGLNGYQLFSFSVALICAIIFFLRKSSIARDVKAVVAKFVNFLHNVKRRLKRLLPKKRYEVSQ